MSAGASGNKYYSAFNPLMFGHPCTLWLDSADSNTLTVGSGRVSKWADKSGSSNDASQNTFALQPTYSSNGVSFDITRSTVMRLPDASIWSSNNSLSIFFAITPQSNSTTNVYLFQGNTAGASGTWAALGLYTTGTQYADYWQGVIAANWGAMTVGTTDVTSYIYQRNSTVTAYTNGISNYSRAQGAYTVSNTPAYLGAEPGRSLYSTCDIKEVIIYQAAVTDSERQQIEGYLAWKWNLRTTRFSNTHIYYSVPPIARAFSPLDISGCAIWIDAADRTVMTLSGSNITAMRDKASGRSYTISSTNPVYDSNGRGGFGRIQFSGASFIRDASASIPLANRCVFIVGEQTSASTTGAEGFLSMGGGPGVNDWGTTNGIVYQGRSTTQNTAFHVYANTGDYNVGYLSSTTPRPTPFAIYSDSFTPNSGSLYANGYLLGTDDGYNVGTANGYVVGARLLGSSTPSTFLNGYIYEILYYSNALSASQRRQVEGYLAKKWNAQLTPTLSLSNFSPPQIPSCALWLDANDSATLTISGSTIIKWSDKSGNARDVSAYGVITNTGTINGLTATSFTNPNTYFRGDASNIGNSVTVFAVFNMSSNAASNARVVSLGRAGVNDYDNGGSMAAMVRANGTSFIQGTRVNGLTGASNTVGLPVMLCAMVNVSSFVMYANGLLTGTSSITTANFNYSNHVIGTNANLTDNLGYFAGTIGEVIIYNTPLVDVSRQQVERYLATKWKLSATGFPSTHPFVNCLPMTASFNPRQISNCALWLDAADSSTLTLSGSNVTQWNDKSGNGRNTSTLFRAPTFSNRSVQFNNQGLSVNLSASTNVESGFFVAGFTNYNQQNTLIGAATGNGGRQFRVGTNTAIQTLRQDVAGVLFSGAAVPAATTVLVEYVNNGSLLTHYLNGGTYASGTAAAYTAGLTTSIGQRFGDFASEALVGYINEIIIYNTALTNSERQQIEGYLAWKWGLQGPSSTLQYTAFTPTTISGCSLWLDAADSSTLTLSGSNVTQWRDKSGSNNNASVTGTITYSNSLNGLPAMNFSGSMNTYFTGPVTNTGTTLTAIAVFNMGSSSYAGARVLSLGKPATFDYNSALYVAAILRRVGSSLGSYRNGVDNSNTTTIGIPTIAASTYTGTSSTFHILGTPGNTVASTGNFGYSNYEIGTSFGEESINNYSGSIAEVIVYNTALSTTDRQNVEGYLAMKWGLQGNLPSTHPYANKGLPSTHPYKNISPV